MGISDINFNFTPYLEVEILKEGVQSPPRILLLCTHMVDLLLCTRISDIVCDEVVQPPVFSTFRYGYEVEFSPRMPFWWCAQKLKVASRINKRHSGKFQGHRMSLTWVIKKWFQNTNPVTIYLPNFNNRSTKTRSELCPKLTVKTNERIFFEHTSHLGLVFLVLTLNR